VTDNSAGLTQADRECDVLVVGEGLAGTAAALAAASLGARTVLVKFQRWLGGQATSQGVSNLDEETPGDGFPHWSASYRAFRDGIRRHYLDQFEIADVGNATDWAEGPALDPGDCWVSRLSFEPDVAAGVLDAMLAPHLRSGRLEVMEGYRLGSVMRDHDTVKGVGLVGNAGPLTIKAKVTVEATELGNVLLLGGVPFRVGAEARAETGEVHARSEPAPCCIQPFTFVFFLERRPEGEEHGIAKPPGYDPSAYSMEMERRFFVFDDPSGQQTFWTYRRAFAADNVRGACRFDLAQINWAPTGNDFNSHCLNGVPSGCDILDADEQHVAAVLQRGREHALGFAYWLQHDVPRDDGRGRGYPNLRLAVELFPGDESQGLAPVPYIREARRVVAVTRVREQDIIAQGDLARARLFTDAVGTGWYAMDLHRCAAGEPTLGSRMWNRDTRPFQIPLGMLIPDQVDGLLVTGKAAGTTHLTNGAYRVHPVEWHSGEAAGTAAALAAAEGVEPRALLYGRRLRRLQNVLVRERRMPLFWWADISPSDTALFEAAHMLGAAGILVGWSDDLLFRPGEEVTQAEFANVAAHLFGPGRHRIEPGPRPKDAITRAAAIASIVRSEGWPDPRTARPSFVDVPRTRGVWQAVESAREHGLLDGVVAGDHFHPDGALTRRTLALIAENLLRMRYGLLSAP